MTRSKGAGGKRGSKLPDFMRKAGGMFGLDLAGLFDDEKENGGIPEGFAPTFRITSQLKGRSPGTLTYKAPKTPSRVAEFELAPDLRTPQPAAFEAPEETAQPISPPRQTQTAAAQTAAAQTPVQTLPAVTNQPAAQTVVTQPAAKADEFATRIAGAYQREFERQPLKQEIEDWRGTGLGIQEAERQLDVHPLRDFGKAVTEYYTSALGRAPAQSEIEDWRGTGYNLEKIKGELDVHPLRDFGKAVTEYYTSALGRAPAQSEIEDWRGTGYNLEKIKTDLMTIGQREKGGTPASAAPISDNFAQQVGSFYQKSLGRAPAAKEIEDWRGTGYDINKIQSDLATIGQRQASTPAPAPAPAAQSAPTPSSDGFAQQVASFYQQSLGRTPAAKEIEDWRGTGQDINQIRSNLALIGARR